MKKVKVKDLEAFLSRFSDKNASVVIVDVDGAELSVTNIIETQGNSLGLETQEEFPDSWFDEQGNEIIWDLFWTEDIERGTISEEAELEVEKPGLIDATMVINFRIYDGFACSDVGVMMTYPKTADLTPEQIDEINDYGGGAVFDSKTVLPRDVALKYGKLSNFTTVMDTTNSHDRSLVDAINAAWSQGNYKFCTILIALYDRDLEEIMDSDAFKWPEAADSDYIFSDLQTQWDAYAENYLMHIADDQDLETILKFIRHDK